MKMLILLLAMSGFFACNSTPSVVEADHASPEVLTIYPDGRMEFRNRTMNKDEVVIYPDGFGGERAAVRVWVPLRPEKHKDSVYFRDTIVVNRINTDEEI